VSFNPKDQQALLDVNVEGTANVVNACLGQNVKHLVYVSSTAAVGKGDGTKPVVESNDWDEEGISNYALSKHYAENEVWRGNAEGLDVIIVNPCVIIGPGDWNKSSATIFKTLHKGLKFYTPAANAFVDVRDVVRAMLTLEEKQVWNERFLLIGENLPYKTLFEKVAQALNVKAPSTLVKGIWVQLFWRLEWVRSVLTGAAPVVTKESAQSAVSHVTFSAQKIEDAIGFTFTPIDKAAQHAATFYLGKWNK
jgi:nucleoside-diphosphate-sugar epimerase